MAPGDRPRQPQLSAAAARAANRPPLTPKVASSRGPQQPLASPLAGPRRSDTSSPYLTPRTLGASRQQQQQNADGAASPDTPRSTLGSSSQVDGGGGRSSDDPDSKFFYASSAVGSARPSSHQPPPREQQHPQTARPSSVPQKPVNFFHANGLPVDGRRTTSPPHGGSTVGSPANFTPVLAATPEPTATKFFYANGTPDYAAPRPQLTTSGSGSSTVSTGSRVPPTSRPTTGPAPILSPSSRPMSPVKGPSSTLSAAPSLQAAPARQQTTSPPYLAPAANVSGSSVGSKRRVSIETPARDSSPTAASAVSRTRAHGRNGSVTNLESITVPPPRSPQSVPMPNSPPLSPGLTQPAMTMASLLQAAEDLEEESGSEGGDHDGSNNSDTEGPSDGDVIPPGMQSPTKSAVSANDTVSELVANARRERKVQDLEIRNASLEAINRTLERQLRRQTAELRRYRRLSRSGHLSAMSSRVTSAALTEPLSELDEGDETLDIDADLSLHESDFPSDYDESMDEDDDEGDEETRMAARRKRDEMRLQLDLSKHQELLVDSQKLNTSIKRCLDWTDVLIKEGAKALTYHVRVSDVELGGHVLPPDDEDASVTHTRTTSVDTGLSTAQTLPSNDAGTIQQPNTTSSTQPTTASTQQTTQPLPTIQPSTHLPTITTPSTQQSTPAQPSEPSTKQTPTKTPPDRDSGVELPEGT